MRLACTPALARARALVEVTHMYLIMLAALLSSPEPGPELSKTFIHVVENRCVTRPLDQGRGSVKVCPGGAL